ncbi:MAG TPA: DUF6603 domain-containing protein, partial [Polyangia bacterium]
RGIRAHLHAPDEATGNGFLGDANLDPEQGALTAAFMDGIVAGQFVELGFTLMNLPGANPGFILQPLIPDKFTVPLGRDFSIETKTNVGSTAFGILVRPLSGLELKYPGAPGTPAPAASVDLTFAPAQPRVLLGTEGETRLEMKGAKTGIAVASAGGLDIEAHAETIGMQLVIETSDADSFVGLLIGTDKITVPLSVGLRWSVQKGFSFSGSGKFEITLTPNLEIGPVTIPTIGIAVGGRPSTPPSDPNPKPMALMTAVTLGIEASLGPVDVTVDQIGVSLDFVNKPGLLGPYDLDVGFKFPKGIGIFIDAGSVAGGGFLSIDEAAGKYSGALELRIYEINVKAFGLIETKVPGVPFSFVIVISAEFEPIQLGFGFMLLGIGGIIGINRTVSMDALAAAVKAGTLDNILFPDDVIANAPKIISDLAALFPAAESKYVFGPMAKLTWLFLVNGTLGLVLEWPSKKVVIIGTISAVLPRPDNAIVKLKMDIGGVLDFPKKHFELNASLDPEESKAGGYTLSGDMAMRLDWGDQPNFAISVGGFNPGYTAPPAFPFLRPMAIELGIEGNPRMTVKGYMALTSNSAQVGARLDAEVHKYGADVSGFLGFDAIIVFSPFHFSATLAGGVHVSFLGVGFDLTLTGTLSGPAPWRLDGEICVGVWPFEACPDFHIQLTGDTNTPTLPKLDPWEGKPFPAAAQDQEVPGLLPAIQDLRNWQGVIAPGRFIGVTYTETDAATPKVDPVGVATFRQKAVPLDYPISRFADTTPKRQGELKITAVAVGAQIQSTTPTQDWFAPGRYREMEDKEKLSTQPFEYLNAGVTITSASIAIGTVAPPKTVNYRTFLMAADGSTADQGMGFTPSSAQLTGMATYTSAARPLVRTIGGSRFTDFTLKPKIIDPIETYTVATKAGLTVVGSMSQTLSRSQAAAALQGLVGPALATKQLYLVVSTTILGT